MISWQDGGLCARSPGFDKMAIVTQRLPRPSAAPPRSGPLTGLPIPTRPASEPASDSARPSFRVMQNMVQQEDLSVVFQPIVDIHTGLQFATEALVRCRIPQLADPLTLFRQAVVHQ